VNLALSITSPAGAREFWRAGSWVSLVTLASAFSLKLAYSKAGATQLDWVLAPSCWLASHFGGLVFTKEVGAGFISHESRMVVGAACAGVNFLVVCWLALFFTVQSRFDGARPKLASWAVSLLGAYAATIATNGLRIVLAARFYDLDIYAGWITPGRVHRALGVVLYCSALFGLCRTADRLAARTVRSRAVPQARRSLLVPFLCYLGVAIGIPLANRSFVRDPAHFAEHVAMTLAVGLATAVAFRLIGWALDRLSSRRAAS
jgi:exosortase K